MSVTAYAFLPRANVPDRASLQRSITALGFELELDRAERPFEVNGFLPFQVFETQAGFEVTAEAAAAVVARNPGLAALAGANDHCIRQSWRGDDLDFACALIVGA